MKNWKKLTSDSMLSGRGKKSSAIGGITFKETERTGSFNGLTQETYINFKELGKGMVSNMVNMSFSGLWM
jgi:hypothetical protein